jgi:hypothetical protein
MILVLPFTKSYHPLPDTAHSLHRSHFPRILCGLGKLAMNLEILTIQNGARGYGLTVNQNSVNP